MKTRMRFVVLLLLGICGSAFAQQPTIVTINSSPLRINVGSDGSFQVFNSAVPGTGQIFPQGCTLADMGVFLFMNDVLYAPNFAAHGCGTATGNLGDYTPWEPIGISAVTGDGTRGNPFSVSVGLRAPNTDVTATVTVTYVRGNNFFRLRKQFFSTSGVDDANIFLGADIFLAGSDDGIYRLEPTLNAPGGLSCDEEEDAYNILLIPLTPATRFTASDFSDVWAQIAVNELDNDATPEGCVDNGAALQWNDIFATTLAVEFNSAISFGEIPSRTAFEAFAVSATPSAVEIRPGQSVTFNLTVTRNPEVPFNSPVTFFAELPEGLTATFNPTGLGAPGAGTATVTVTAAPNVFPGTYRNVAFFATGGNETHGTTVTVSVLCDPPLILSVDNPQSQTVKRGSTVTLRVRSAAEGAASYQWYRGVAPLTFDAIPGATSAEFTTPAVNDLQQYWVRVTNACGTADSNTATLIPID